MSGWRRRVRGWRSDRQAAQAENITRAADLLHVTQPTLSRQIMDLERELGVALMLRAQIE